MQEKFTQKTIALPMKTGKLTAQALQMALKKYLEARKHGPKLHHGQQSLKQLKQHGAALPNIEITAANIAAFKPCAGKAPEPQEPEEPEPQPRKTRAAWAACWYC